MKVVIFGLGYVGFTAACCIASEGHSVVGVDVSEKKVRTILGGTSPIVEPGVEDMLKKGLADGLIHADVRINGHLDDADMAIVCVGTPSGLRPQVGEPRRSARGWFGYRHRRKPRRGQRNGSASKHTDEQTDYHYPRSGNCRP